MARRKDEFLRDLEQEVQKEIGITKVGQKMTTREAGKIGGNMVRKLIERGRDLEHLSSKNSPSKDY